MENSRNHLGINKFGKNIRKNPLPFSNQRPPPPHPLHPPPPPQVYNISKNDFRTIVQQLTGTPPRDPLPNPNPNPPHPKPSSMRLQRIRPPPLTPIARPNSIPRPAPAPAPAWAESPVSSYMRYLETSLFSSDPSRPLHPANGLLPSPSIPTFPSPWGNPPPALLPSPGSQFPLPSPNSQFPLPSPNSQFPLPSPNSQFPLPSPSGFLNLLSPRSPYPLLSPGFQHPPPLTPNFFSPMMSQSGILGPGPQPLPSPGHFFPQSPSGFYPFSSPRWRDL